MAHVASRQLHTRFWIEASLGSLSALLFAVTLAWPTWIELVLRVDPDFGSGKLEWAIALLTSVLALSGFALAGREWSKARAAVAHAQDGADR